MEYFPPISFTLFSSFLAFWYTFSLFFCFFFIIYYSQKILHRFISVGCYWSFEYEIKNLYRLKALSQSAYGLSFSLTPLIILYHEDLFSILKPIESRASSIHLIFEFYTFSFIFHLYFWLFHSFSVVYLPRFAKTQRLPAFSSKLNETLDMLIQIFMVAYQ